jgi:hypothetical protein
MGRRTWSRRSCPCHLWSLDLKNHVLTCVEIKGPLAWLEILEMDLFLEISWDMVSHTHRYIYIYTCIHIYIFSIAIFSPIFWKSIGPSDSLKPLCFLAFVASQEAFTL